MNRTHLLILIGMIGILFFGTSLHAQDLFADHDVTIELYYYSTNPSSLDKKSYLEETFANNSSYASITLRFLDVRTDNDSRDVWQTTYNYFPYPFIVITVDSNMSEPIGEMDISEDHIISVITNMSMAQQDDDDDDNPDTGDDTDKGTPGFTVGIISVAFVVFVVYSRRRR